MILVHNDARLNASITLSQVEESPNWRPYFTVESTADAVRTVGSRGGATVLEPVPIPDGSIAVVRDPQGALFGLFEGEVDP
jgi:predicted enzyme related to lactoylglutathione lyase